MKFFPSLAVILTVAFSSCCNKNCIAPESADSSVESKNEIVRLNVFYTLNDGADADAMKAIADSLVVASRNDVGCISYDMFESTTTPGQYIIVETWENDSLLDIHSHAPHFEKYVPLLRDLGTMAPQRCMIME